ncbi:MAG TPA: glutathione S-transferase family protein [Sphingomonas sp.]|nr:glutathione S-transferase family protein [Sphingomonas sp.]
MNLPSRGLTLYHTPATCSRVVLNALEELGLAYEDRPVDIFKGEQRSAAYLAINPKGKVPALVSAGVLITETPAIVWWLNETYPEGGLLPVGDPLARALALSDLVWCSNSLHPLVRLARMPQRATHGDPAPVRAAAVEQLVPALAMLQLRLGHAPWWFGEQWSVLDVYLAWIAGMCTGAGIDLSAYPALIGHEQRVRRRDGFQRALLRERSALKVASITLPGEL